MKQPLKETIPTPGFAIQLLPGTDLRVAILIAEDEEGNYEPVALALTIAEGEELAQIDIRSRLQCLERDQDPGLCPFSYKLWARGLNGAHHVAATWNVSEL